MFDLNNIHKDKTNTYWVCDYTGNSAESVFSKCLPFVNTSRGENNSCAMLVYNEPNSLSIQSTDLQLVENLAKFINLNYK